MTSKNVKCALAIIFMAMVMVMPGKAFADIREVKVTGVYLLGEVETPVLGKERATREALRQAAEQVGVYITSSSQMRNNVITKDDVTAVSAAVLRVKNKTFLAPVIEEKDGELLTRVAVDLVVEYDTDLVDRVLSNEVEIRTIRTSYSALEKDFTDYDKKLIQIKAELKREGVKNIKYAAEVAKLEKEYIAFSLIDSAQRSLTNKEFDKALSELNQSLNIKSDTGFAYLLKTVIFIDVGNYDEAIRSIDRAMTLIPSSDVNYYWRGIANYRKGNYAWAIEDFSQAIKLYPKDDGYYSSRALAYMEAGYYKEATKDAKKAIFINQNSDIGYLALARLCDLTRDYRNQVYYCQRVLDLSGDDDEGLMAKLSAYYMMGKYKDTIIIGETMISGNMLHQSGDIANIYGLLASCCCGLGDADRALQYVEKGIKVRYNGELENVELAKRDIDLEITRLANLMSEKKLAWRR